MENIGNVLGNLFYRNKINRQEYNIWMFIAALILNGKGDNMKYHNWGNTVVE